MFFIHFLEHNISRILLSFSNIEQTFEIHEKTPGESYNFCPFCPFYRNFDPIISTLGQPILNSLYFKVPPYYMENSYASTYTANYSGDTRMVETPNPNWPPIVNTKPIYQGHLSIWRHKQF